MLFQNQEQNAPNQNSWLSHLQLVTLVSLTQIFDILTFAYFIVLSIGLIGSFELGLLSIIKVLLEYHLNMSKSWKTHKF